MVRVRCTIQYSNKEEGTYLRVFSTEKEDDSIIEKLIKDDDRTLEETKLDRLRSKIIRKDKWTGKVDMLGRYVFENDEFIYHDCLRVIKYREDNMAFMAEPVHKDRDWNRSNFFLRDVLNDTNTDMLNIQII